MSDQDNRPTSPKTISDEQWADLMRRREKGRTRSMFDPDEVRQRKQSTDQARKRRWS
ncbi:hypothetical protein [Nonomuraea lactucae]|uniref:hypothetical protein n=1 Tax=Nonomuraea lactucae TaxID=2249762 RepID=UPI0013B44D31|nr:hypothetical protein [Nonomuraea lactucae]